MAVQSDEFESVSWYNHYGKNLSKWHYSSDGCFSTLCDMVIPYGSEFEVFIFEHEVDCKKCVAAKEKHGA